MGAPAHCIIGDTYTFSITTHDPSNSGSPIDADLDPTYLIYEDETSTAILSGNMSKLDDTNTVGFYSETILCDETAGFEDGKSYTIYVEATITPSVGDTIPANIAFSFKAIVEQDLADVFLESNIDSTGDSNPLTVRKAMEVIFGILGGIADYDSGTGLWTIKGRDGSTTIYTGTVTDEGDRTTSEVS